MKIFIKLLLLGVILNACQNSKTESTSTDSTLAIKQETPTNDFVCVPGERVGIITASTTLEELQAKFGNDVSARDTVYIGEGYFEIGTILFKGTPNELQILWKDTTNFKNPANLMIGRNAESNPTQTQWNTNTGIKIGTTLKELEQINGKAFKFMGFGWDYGGSVANWNGGKLMEADGVSYFTCVLGYNYEDQSLNPLADKLLGDSEFSSSQVEAQKLNPVIINFQISFR